MQIHCSIKNISLDTPYILAMKPLLVLEACLSKFVQSECLMQILAFNLIGLDKSGYRINIFLISPRKQMLWVFIRSASLILD